MGKNWRTAKIVVDSNELLMQKYCKWVVDKCKLEYPDSYHEPIEEIAHIYMHERMALQVNSKRYEQGLIDIEPNSEIQLDKGISVVYTIDEMLPEHQEEEKKKEEEKMQQIANQQLIEEKMNKLKKIKKS